MGRALGLNTLGCSIAPFLFGVGLLPYIGAKWTLIGIGAVLGEKGLKAITCKRGKVRPFIADNAKLNELVKPASVIFTHPNEAVSEGGKLRPATRAAALAALIWSNVAATSYDDFWSTTLSVVDRPSIGPRSHR